MVIEVLVGNFSTNQRPVYSDGITRSMTICEHDLRNLLEKVQIKYETILMNGYRDIGRKLLTQSEASIE
jgi:hypothetical protein